MAFYIDSSLKFLIADLEVYRDESVGEILVGYDEKNDEKVQSGFKNYRKYDRLISLGLEMLIDGQLEEWDWKYAADYGWLCEMDFEEDWCKKDLEKVGITKKDYLENWEKWREERKKKAG